MTRHFSPIIALILLLTPAIAHAGPGSLDGMKFEGTVTREGRTKGDKDTLVFENGQFVSTACVRYGFDKTAYSAKRKGKETSWSVDVFSTKHQGEKMSWTGTVAGGSLDGKMYWMKNDGTVTKYIVQGAKK
jgi:hypothetical protein